MTSSETPACTSFTTSFTGGENFRFSGNSAGLTSLASTAFVALAADGADSGAAAESSGCTASACSKASPAGDSSAAAICWLQPTQNQREALSMANVTTLEVWVFINSLLPNQRECAVCASIRPGFLHYIRLGILGTYSLSTRRTESIRRTCRSMFNRSSKSLIRQSQKRDRSSVSRRSVAFSNYIPFGIKNIGLIWRNHNLSSKSARQRRAILTAPGVSECTQIVQTLRNNELPRSVVMRPERFSC